MIYLKTFQKTKHQQNVAFLKVTNRKHKILTEQHIKVTFFSYWRSLCLVTYQIILSSTTTTESSLRSWVNNLKNPTPIQPYTPASLLVGPSIDPPPPPPPLSISSHPLLSLALSHEENMRKMRLLTLASMAQDNSDITYDELIDKLK